MLLLPLNMCLNVSCVILRASLKTFKNMPRECLNMVFHLWWCGTCTPLPLPPARRAGAGGITVQHWMLACDSTTTTTSQEWTGNMIAWWKINLAKKPRGVSSYITMPPQFSIKLEFGRRCVCHWAAVGARHRFSLGMTKSLARKAQLKKKGACVCCHSSTCSH